MQSSGWTILEQNDDWWIARIAEATPELRRVEINEKATAEELAKTIAAQLAELGYRSQEDAILCLASGGCLAAKLTSAATPADSSPETLSFQLEEFLPVSAEQFVADFIPVASGTLGVAIIAEAIRPLLQALDVAGVSIRSIIPATILATQSVIQTPANQLGGDAVLVWPSDSAFDVVCVEGGVISDWLYIRGDSSALEQNLWMLMSGREIPIFVCRSDVETESESAADLQHYGCLSVPPLTELVAVAVGDVLAGKLIPAIDLRREKLASRTPYHSLQKLITVAAIAACVFLMAMIIGLEYRSWRYEQSAQEYQLAMEQVFLQIFPKQQIPLGIRSRLESEHSKTVGLRDTKKIPEVASAAETFRVMLAALPDTLRYRLTEISVQGRQLKIDGEVRTHGDAASLATVLTETGFEVQPPRTVQASGGNVTVTLSAEYRPTEKAKKEIPRGQKTSDDGDKSLPKPLSENASLSTSVSEIKK